MRTDLARRGLSRGGERSHLAVEGDELGERGHGQRGLLELLGCRGRRVNRRLETRGPLTGHRVPVDVREGLRPPLDWRLKGKVEEWKMLAIGPAKDAVVRGDWTNAGETDGARVSTEGHDGSNRTRSGRSPPSRPAMCRVSGPSPHWQFSASIPASDDAKTDSP